MAATFAEAMDQIVNLVAIADDIRTDGQTSVVTKLDTYIQSLEGDGAPAAGAAAQAVRAAYNRAMLSTRSSALAHLIDVGIAINSNAAPDTDEFWDDLTQYMVDNYQNVQTRDITFGSVSAGASNVGTGTVYCLTVDRHGEPIEAVYLDTVVFECAEDQNTGTAIGKERFLLKMGNASIDRLNEAGAPFRGVATAVSGDEILRNASFGVRGGSSDASPTSVPRWTVGDIANFEFDSTNYFRPSPQERGATPRSLKIKATETVTQKLSTINQSLVTGVPYMALLRYNRAVGSATGTLVLRVGSNSATVAVSAQTGWNTLALTIDENLWYENFAEDDLDIQIDWTRTSGDILVDDVVFAPMTQYDNLWYCVVGGATAFLYNDRFTFENALAGSDGKFQSWLWRWFNRSLPSSKAATQVTAAGGRTLTFADTGDTITASSGSFVSDGYEIGMTLTVAGTSSNNGTFTITNVTATVITVEADDLADEGPLSSTATLNATGVTISDP